MSAPPTIISRFRDLVLAAPSEDLAALNPVWAYPDHGRKVIVFTNKNNRVQQGLAYWDHDTRTWRKVDGTSIEILGWKS
jgi:hypothetical protein